MRYVRAPEPLVFPEEEEVPEGYLHLVVRTFLFQLLRRSFCATESSASKSSFASIPKEIGFALGTGSATT